MSKRVKNRKGKLGCDAKHNKQYRAEGSSFPKDVKNLQSGSSGGFPWWQVFQPSFPHFFSRFGL